jgi:DinB superfamily
MNPEIALLLGLLDEAFDAKAWHGPSLRLSLRGLTARDAAWRPAPGRHNVWEIAVHAAYWKYVVRRHLSGAARGSFALRGSNWFARDAALGERAWRADGALRVGEQRALRAAVARQRPRELSRKPAGARHTRLALIRGAAAHDLYHAGQIQLLKRLRRG